MIDNFEKLYMGVCSIYKSIQKIKKSEMNIFGLSGKHVMPFYYLLNHSEGLTASEICKLSNADKAGVSRSLAEMKEEGYIYYEDDGDKKKYRNKIFLTEKGKEKAKAIRHIILQLTMENSQTITQEEREIFYRVLGMIAESLGEISES